jgi:flagellar hook-basal body complex protein FliE
MVEKINSQGNIQSMLQTLRSYQSQAAGGMDEDGNKVGGLNGLNGSEKTQGPAGFGDLVRQTVNKVNENQTNASKIAASYERGEGVP